MTSISQPGTERRLGEGGAAGHTPKAWAAFAKKYRAEMGTPENARTLDLLAALSHGSDFSMGCYCEDESHCHRSVLRTLLSERGANLIAG